MILKKTELSHFTLECGLQKNKIPLFYQIFGQPVGTAPVVLVNHALTGNSNVAGEKGWWNPIIGEDKVIDTAFFTIIAFNIPGNGFDEDENNLIHDYKNFSAKDIANLFWEGLSGLKINKLFAVIGGSLGGGIAWEMAALKPNSITNLIPIATDWKATDWVIGNVLIQDQLLNNSADPIADARLHAMLLYRTPKSINLKFARTKLPDSSFFQVENWLLYHGMKLKKRFTLPAYKLMNHLLKTIDITKNANDFEFEISKISANIYQIAIDTDLLFSAEENKATHKSVLNVKSNIYYHEIKSIYGHDAFLIEHKQLIQILKPIFQTQKIKNYARI
jgi:homoserine O-acetyltransferase